MSLFTIKEVLSTPNLSEWTTPASFKLDNVILFEDRSFSPSENKELKKDKRIQ
jgi:hypothetical protein